MNGLSLRGRTESFTTRAFDPSDPELAIFGAHNGLGALAEFLSQFDKLGFGHVQHPEARNNLIDVHLKVLSSLRVHVICVWHFQGFQAGQCRRFLSDHMVERTRRFKLRSVLRAASAYLNGRWI